VAALGAGGAPFAFDSVEVSVSSVARADGSAHLLLEGCGELLIACVGVMYVGDVAEASLLHVFDDVFSDIGLVVVFCPDILPVVLEPIDVADDGAVHRLQWELVAVNQIQVSATFFGVAREKDYLIVDTDGHKTSTITFQINREEKIVRNKIEYVLGLHEPRVISS